MKLLATLLGFIATFSSFALASFPDEVQCNKDNPNAMPAIQKLCDNHPGGDNIMIPSNYLAKGAKVGDTTVYAKGSCNPPQWLPRGWCHTHFRVACANSGGFGGQCFGCQCFYINKD